MGQNPIGAITTNLYDAASRKIGVVDANSNCTTSVFDAAGQLTGNIDPLNRRTTMGYDPAGNQVTRIDPRGIVLTRTFDAANRLVSETYSTAKSNSYGYDPVNNRVRISDGTGVYTTAYDADYRVIQAINAAGLIVSYAYDNAARRSTLTDPNGGIFTYVFDAAGRLTQLTNPQGKITTEAYDATGRLVQQSAANGTISTFIFDAAGRKTNVINGGAGSSIVNSFTYTFDKVGNKTKVSEANGDVTTWQYDGANQLVRETRSGLNGFDVTHVYDLAGNRTLQVDGGVPTTFAFDQADQILTAQEAGVGTTTYTHDEAGNRTEQNAPGGITYYGWDEENHMTSAEPPAGPVTMAYNADGQRVQKQTPSATTKFLYDFNKVLEETDGLGHLTKEYTSTDDVYGDLVSEFNGAATSYHQFNAQGSTDALLDDTASTKDKWVYRAYGSAAQTQGTDVTAFTFIGKQSYYFDLEIGLYLASIRSMDPATARWLSKDPIPGEPNPYLYGDNNPLNRVDPSGLQPDPWWRKFVPGQAGPQPPAGGPPEIQVAGMPVIPPVAGMGPAATARPASGPGQMNAAQQVVPGTPAATPRAGAGQTNAAGGIRPPGPIGAGAGTGAPLPLDDQDLIRLGFNDEKELQGIHNWWNQLDAAAQAGNRWQLWNGWATPDDLHGYIKANAGREIAKVRNQAAVDAWDRMIAQIQDAREASEAAADAEKKANNERARKSAAAIRAILRIRSSYLKMRRRVSDLTTTALEAIAQFEAAPGDAAQAVIDAAALPGSLAKKRAIEDIRLKTLEQENRAARRSPQRRRADDSASDSGWPLPPWFSWLAGPSSKPRSTRTGVPGSQPVEAPRTPIDDHLDKIADFAKEMGGGIEALRQALMRDFEGPIRIGGKYLDWLLIAMPLPRVDRVIREGNYWHLIPGATQLIDAWRTVKHTLFDAAPDAADYEKMLQGSKDPSNAKARGWLMAITHRAPGSSFVWRLAEVTFNFESGANEYGRKLKPVERIERAMDIVAEGATMIIAGLGGKGRKQGKAAAASEEGELSAPKVLRSPRYGNYVRRVDDFKHALSPEHVKTALLEKEGTTVKINPKTGRPYDHLGETRRAMHGAFDRIALLKKYLSDPELSTELRTAVQSELGELSNMLDNAERILGESAR